MVEYKKIFYRCSYALKGDSGFRGYNCRRRRGAIIFNFIDIPYLLLICELYL